MDLDISGRKAIICASSRGLGRACAEALAEAGVDIVINGRDGDVLQKTADDIAARCDVKVTPVAADLSTRDGQALLLKACPDPDILVNNNGGPPLRDFRELTRDDMVDGVVMNMITPIEMIQAVIEPMTERKFGRIVNITSFSVKMPIVGLDLSSGARAGLTGFVAGVARSVAASNVTINGILPGMMDTDRLRGNNEKMAAMKGLPVAELVAERAASIPAGRFGTAREFGQFCAYLCSAQAAYITGQNILVDGGLFNGAM